MITACHPVSVTFDPAQRFLGFVPGGNGVLYGIQADGALLWKVQAGTVGINSQPAIGGDGTLYVLSNDSFLYAIGP